MDWTYSLAGLVVGFVVGLTGVGGGSLMTPLLVALFGGAPATAVGTDLLYAGLTKSAGSWVHARRGNVDWHLAGRLALGSVPGAALGLLLLKGLLADARAVSGIITWTLGAALVLTAAALLFRERLKNFSIGRAAAWRERHGAAATVAVGFTLGVLVSVSSVGAGALGVAALLFLHPVLPAVRIVGTDIAHAVPLTLVAGLGHAALGTVDYALLGSLLVGSLPGIWLGSHLGGSIPERVLRPALAGVLVLVAGKLVI
ncbi:MAG TPA: sulfite exporter TauE/SafE family protein [Burkholderiales bacterium]